ncbi:MAG: hypothetical protein Q8N08_03765 [Methanobacteriaceae archaeon]|nr:hypothetical protein [Methanobacteriaceae archaeon]
MSYLNPDKGEMSPLQRNLLRIMRIFLLVAGIYITIFGGANGAERIFGILILVALAIINAPSFITKGKINAIPVEIELILLSMVLFELVWGDAMGLYVKLPYYDNFMHFMLPLYIALISMMLVYTMYYYRRLKMSLAGMAIVIVVVTIGLGGILEMGEYTYDKYLSQGPLGDITGNTQMQGSPTQDAHEDTMNDLFTDTAGGIVGALIGVLLIRRAEKEGGHWKIAEDVEKMTK